MAETPTRKRRAPKGGKNKGGAPTKRTAAAEKRILSILSVGGTWAMAAAAGKVSDDTLKRWRDDDAGFAGRCACARDGGAAKLVEKIRQEAEDGDWRAAAWLLERIAAEQYGRRTVVTGDPAGVPIKIDGELRVAGDVRSSKKAMKKLHDAIATAAANS